MKRDKLNIYGIFSKFPEFLLYIILTASSNEVFFYLCS